MKHLLLALGLLMPTCPMQPASPLQAASPRSGSQVVFIAPVNTGSPSLDAALRVICRKSLEKNHYHIAEKADLAQLALQIEVRQLAQPDTYSVGKFVQIDITDIKTHQRVFNSIQDAGHATDQDIVHAAEMVIAEYIHPSIPPPPIKQ